MRPSSLASSLLGMASTHFRPIVMVSASTNWMRSFSGDRKSDNSGKKLKIGSLMLPISPRSMAIPSASDATLFVADLMLCSVSASKVTLSTRRPLISSEPLKYRSNTSLPPRATMTACTLALEATSRSAILHSASRSTSLSSLTEATGQPSSRAIGTPQPSGGSAYNGNAVSGASEAPPRSATNRRRITPFPHSFFQIGGLRFALTKLSPHSNGNRYPNPCRRGFAAAFFDPRLAGPGLLGLGKIHGVAPLTAGRERLEGGFQGRSFIQLVLEFFRNCDRWILLYFQTGFFDLDGLLNVRFYDGL